MGGIIGYADYPMYGLHAVIVTIYSMINNVTYVIVIIRMVLYALHTSTTIPHRGRYEQSGIEIIPFLRNHGHSQLETISQCHVS